MSYKLHTKEIVRRNRKIYKMRMKGMTFNAIGETFAISAQRVSQVFHSVRYQMNKRGYYR